MDVPITLQSMVILVLPIIFRPRLALLSVALFLLAAFFGLPLLSGGASGPDHFVGKSGGYLFGFLVVALIAGLVGTHITRRHLVSYFALFLALHIALMALGTTWICVLGNSISAETHLLPYLPGAVIKSALGASICWLVKTRFKST